MPKSEAALDRAALARAAWAAAIVLIVALLLIAYGLVDNRWYRIVAINGGSMEPTIHDGDAIVILRPPERLEPGMIVTLQVDRFIVTHRIRSVAPNGSFVTRGDANPTSDDWTGTNVRVVGVCALRLPMLGKMLRGFGPERRTSGAYLTSRAGLWCRVEGSTAEDPGVDAPSERAESPSAAVQTEGSDAEPEALVDPVEEPGGVGEGAPAPPDAGDGGDPPAVLEVPVEPSGDTSHAP